MKPVRTSAMALPLVLAACASAPTASIEPIEPLRSVEAELLVRPAVRGLEREPFEPWADDVESARRVAVRASFLALDRRVAERHLGAGALGLIAYVVPRERAARLLEELQSEPAGFRLENCTSVEMHEGQAVPISVLERRAFVSGFTLRSDGTHGMADPRVDVAMEGSQLVVAGVRDEAGEQVALDVRLDGCRLADAFDETVFDLGGARVTVQEPRGLLRSLTTHVQLARDEALLVGGASLSDDGAGVATIVLVEAEALPADG